MYRRRKVATVVNLVGLANVLVDLSADEESTRRNVIINECSDSFCDCIRSATMLHMIKDTDLVDTVKVEGFIENTVPSYSLDDFPSHFRMKRSTFQVRAHILINLNVKNLKATYHFILTLLAVNVFSQYHNSLVCA